MRKYQDTKTKNILNHFKSGRSLTHIECEHLFGTYRLADVVHRLRKKGYGIKTELSRDVNGCTYSKYRLETLPGGKRLELLD